MTEFRSRDHAAIELARKEFGDRISKLNDQIGHMRDRMDKMREKNAELQKYAQMGMHFETMLKACENPVVKASWDRFVMTIRLTEEEK